MRARRGFETSSPKAASITPKITDERTAVPAALGISRCFPEPMSRDIITFAPMENTADRLTIKGGYFAVCAHGGKCAIFAEAPDNGGICGIEKLLGHACEKYGQSKNNYFSCKGTA